MNEFLKRRNSQEKNKGLYIGIGIASIIFIIVAIFGYRYWKDRKRKEQANEIANLFIESLETQNYAQLADVLSASSLEKIDYTKEEVTERYETIYDGIGVNEVKVNNIEFFESEDNDSFTLHYDLNLITSLGELETQSYEAKLQSVEDSFFIDWTTNLIFPEMELGDTIQIQFTSGKRGNIYDRNGELLAGEGNVWQVGLYPTMLGDGEEKEKNLQKIADTFSVNVEKLENLLKAEWVTEESFVPFAFADEGETPEINGVVYQESIARTYPLGDAAAHLIGYIGEVFAEDIEKDPSLQSGDIIGKVGLEATFDERLRGEKGGEINILDDNGELKNNLQKAAVKDGEDITLTIDGVLQQRYFDGLQEKSGGAVVTDPTSGELLVLTSSPSFDPTLMSRGISDEDYQAYADNPDSPFLARYSARYAPASTFKVITAAIGLDANVTNLEKTHTITGLEWQKDNSWGDYKVTRVSNQPTEVSLEDAIVYSDNIFFAQEAIEMGAETFKNGLNKFPFDESFDLPINMNPAQITNSGSFDSEQLLADTAFGQGQLLMSPLHQAVFYSPFVNDGTLVFPKLELKAEKPESINPVTKETANIIEKLLIQVVDSPNGTAHILNDSSLSLAAKTGTGEFKSVDEEDKNKINGFLLTFDAEKRSFLSIIFVENESGSDVAKQFSPVIKQHK